MKLTLPRKQFLSALKVSAQGVQAKNILPIMECLKFDLPANSNILTITGGNEEMYIVNTCQMAEPSTSDYSMCINAKDIVDAVSSIDDDEITLSTNDEEGVVEIQYKRGKLSYPFFSSDEYSVMPVGESDSKVSISEEVLAHLINKTIKFVANDPLRPVMNGINFNIGGEGDGILVGVGTNGSSLCKVSVSNINTDECKERQSFILPDKTCQVVLKTIPSNPSPDKMVDISFSEKNIAIEIGSVGGIGGVYIFSRCIEGRYPNYNSVIPKNNTIKIELCKSDFISAISRVSKSLNKDVRLISMNLSLSAIVPEITIAGSNLDFNTSGEESLDCIVEDDSARENMCIGLHKDHIGVAIANASTPNIKMSLLSPTRSILIEGYDGDEGVTILIQPMIITQ